MIAEVFATLIMRGGLSVMLPEERRNWILAGLATVPILRVDVVAKELRVSVETVRRDAIALEHAGLARRVYAGITRVSNDSAEPSYEDRRELHLAAKRAMAELAVSLVHPEDTLILDVGTSVLQVAFALPTSFRGRVITNSLLVAIELGNRSDVSVLVSGGEVRNHDLALSGHSAEAFLAAHHADWAFLGSGGIDAVAGLTDYYPREVAVRQIAIRHAAKAYVLADATKLGRIALQKVCALTELAGIITDNQADPEIVKALTRAGANVLVA
jgi:DeoR family fructose operon transcriptional repressor